MVAPMLRFKSDDGSDYPDWEISSVDKKFKFVVTKNKDLSITNVITNSAEFGLLPQRDFFKKDIANKDNIDGYYVIHQGDFVYNPRKSANAPFGPFNLYEIDEPGIVSPLYTCLTPLNKEWAPYLSYYFQSSCWHNYVETNGAKGARQGRVNMSKALMKGIPISMPTIAEQRKISNFLSIVDDVIVKQQAEVASWEQYKNCVTQKLFDQEVRFKADDGSDFPDWECKKLSEVASMHARIGWQNLRQDEFLDSGDFMLITGTDFQDGLVNFKTCCYVDKWRYEQDQKIQVRNGTVLVTKDGTLGKVAIVKDLPKPATLNAGVFAINPLPMSALIPKYLYHWLRAPMLMNYAKAMSTGGTIKHLNQGILVNFEISVPCLEEQRKIAECLDAIDKVIALSKAELEKWRELKKGLLQQLFV